MLWAPKKWAPNVNVLLAAMVLLANIVTCLTQNMVQGFDLRHSLDDIMYM